MEQQRQRPEEQPQAQQQGQPQAQQQEEQQTQQQEKQQIPQQDEQQIPQQVQLHSSNINTGADYAQMESYLRSQLDKCAHYQKNFEQQRNESLQSQFETYFALTQKDLELLQKCKRDAGLLPKFKFETIRVTCVPTNVDIKDRELQLVVRTSPIPVADESSIYVVGEFDFPMTGREQTVSETAERWVKNVKIEPKNVWCCAAEQPEQLDMICAVKHKPFYDKGSNLTEYERPMMFYVDKPRSRSLKRKFKPIKLNFWEKRNLISSDRRIGTVQVKIDDINDEATLVIRTAITMGRKATEHVADIRVRVREPLVDKSLKTYEEKILVLT